jgi:hypothetical protein
MWSPKCSLTVVACVSALAPGVGAQAPQTFTPKAATRLRSSRRG